MKQKVLISIIGAGGYIDTIYKYEDKVATPGKYSVRAIQELFNPDLIFIAMTPKAREAHYEALNTICDFKEIPIKNGVSNLEFWEIFQSIADEIPDNTELIIDVTTGFRSLPILLLSIAVYLQVVKSVSVEYILYGAFDAKDENGHSPLINLGPFLKLIEWSYATRSFLESGNARMIQQLLKPIHKEAYLSDSYVSSLFAIGSTLTSLTENMSTVRTGKIAETVKKLNEILPKAYADTMKLPEARPLKSLLSKIEAGYAEVACAEKDIFTEQGIFAQTATIEKYLITLQYQQAITLARELIVSLICLNENIDCTRQREDAEKLLNQETADFNNKGLFYAYLTELKNLWREIIQYRNDINHAAMNKSPNPAINLIRNIESACNQLTEIIRKKNK